MNRAIAGVYNRNWSGRGASTTELLTRALAPDGAAHALQDGPFAVGWTGACDPAVLESPVGFCLLDGHLYNLATLAEQAGLAPGHSAEQVLLAAYARWGEALLEQLRGDFVVLIWNRKARKLLVARDQVNARPLYVRVAGDRVVFASEVRNVLRLLERRPAPDAAAVAHWLRHSRVPPDRTLYEGIERVEAGHVLRFADGRFEQRRYWKPTLGPRIEGSRGDLAEQLRAQIVRAMERRCESGTTAVMLSGGLDSTTLAAVGARCLDAERAPVGTYSMTFPGYPASDESPQIDITTARLGLANTRIGVQTTGILSGSLEYLSTWELPPASFTMSFWLPLARRVAQDGVRVILDGENGDDLFGCSPWLVADAVREGRLPAAARLLRGTPDHSSASARLLMRDAYTLVAKGCMPPALHRLVHRLRKPADYAPPWLNDRVARTYYESFHPWDWKLAGEPRWWANRVATLITDGFPAALYDHARRRAAMAGLDRRHPFADLDLISFVHRLPPELAFDRRFNRPLLRSSVAGLVPDEIRLRAPKMNLDAVFDDALAADLPTMRPLMLSADTRLRGYVPARVLEELFAETARYSTEGEKLGYRAWRFIEVECWLRSQDDPSFAADLLEREAVRAPTYTFIERPAPEETAGDPTFAGR